MNYLKFSAIILILLGIGMLYLGYRINGLPPVITGIGFFVISYVFLRLNNKNK